MLQPASVEQEIVKTKEVNTKRRGDRVSTISGQLLILRGNLIKEKLIHKTCKEEDCIRKFKMGNDIHKTTKMVNLKVQEKSHVFLVVPNVFPMPEDGIIRVPLLYVQKFNLNNDSLVLDNKIYQLDNDTITIPDNLFK